MATPGVDSQVPPSTFPAAGSSTFPVGEWRELSPLPDDLLDIQPLFSHPPLQDLLDGDRLLEAAALSRSPTPASASPPGLGPSTAGWDDAAATALFPEALPHYPTRPSPAQSVALPPYQPETEPLTDQEEAEAEASPPRKRPRRSCRRRASSGRTAEEEAPCPPADSTTQWSPQMAGPQTPATPYPGLPSLPPAHSPAHAPDSPIDASAFQSFYASTSGPVAAVETMLSLEDYNLSREEIDASSATPKEKKKQKQQLCDRKQREKKTEAFGTLGRVGDHLVNVLASRPDLRDHPLMRDMVGLVEPYFRRHYGRHRTIHANVASLVAQRGAQDEDH